MSWPGSIGTALVVVVVLLLVALLIREVVLWYFKLNQLHRLLTEIRDLLRESVQVTPGAASSNVQATQPRPEQEGLLSRWRKAGGVKEGEQ